MQRATWTDERLDELSRHIDVRFDKVDERFKLVDEHFRIVDKRFDQIDKRFERVEGAIQNVRTDLRRDLGTLHVDLKSDIRVLQGNVATNDAVTKAEIAGIRDSINALHITLTRWLVGLLICLIGVLAAAALA
jgi:DNA anti-recombination protein RmuC